MSLLCTGTYSPPAFTPHLTQCPTTHPQVDSHFRTTVPSIYAIGDCIPGPMLAHKAEEDGVAAVEIIAGACVCRSAGVLGGWARACVSVRS